jgi:hypothetical protein
MTKDEFDKWMEETKGSRRRWTVDQVRLHNHGEYLFYKGGVDGIFIEVQRGGSVLIGEYEGAIPHIGEALFKVEHMQKVADTVSAALVHTLERLGLTFLMELVGA